MVIGCITQPLKWAMKKYGITQWAIFKKWLQLAMKEKGPHSLLL